MRFINKHLFYVLMAMVLLAFSCKDDDDAGSGGNANNFTATCCEVPHLEACIGGAKIFLPNAFTPNNDGLNDIFRPFGNDGVKQVDLFSISDADGVTIFQLTNFNLNDFGVFGWNGGLPDGELVEAGVYAYTIRFTNVADVMEEFYGFVCCRRDNDAGDLPCVDFEKHCVFGTQHDGDGGLDLSFSSFEECQ